MLETIIIIIRSQDSKPHFGFLCQLSDTLNCIGPFLAGETVTEDPVSPELRLAFCLYRLGRRNYLYNDAPQTSLFCVEQDFSSFPSIFFEYNLLHMATTYKLVGLWEKKLLI